MSNLPASERQGYLGDLGAKPTAELRDLLTRQQHIIANTQFIKKLPDHGEKIKKMTEALEKLLRQRECIDGAADLFEKMALDAERTSRSRGQNVAGTDEEDSRLKEIVNVEMPDKQIIDERKEREPKSDFVNSYQRVIKRAENGVSNKREKYYPHRSIRTKGVHDLPEDLACKPLVKRSDSATEASMDTLPSTNKVETTSQSELPGNVKKSNRSKKGPMTLGDEPLSANFTRRLKYRYDECLERAVAEGQKAHQSAKLIDVDDSLQLMQQQKRKLEELQAKQAAEKLALRLNVTMATYDPEGSRKMEYRDTRQQEDSDGDSCDSDDVVDYLD